MDSTASPAKLSGEGERALTASKTATTEKTENAPSSGGKSSHSTKKVSCPECDRMFPSTNLLALHKRVHVRQRSIPCSHCTVTFRTLKGMNIHLSRLHKVNVKSNKEEDLTWTEPLEEADDETQDLISVRTKPGQQPKSDGEEEQNSELSVKLQTVSKDKQKRFKCLMCPKFFSKKYALVEHMMIHKSDAAH